MNLRLRLTDRLIAQRVLSWIAVVWLLLVALDCFISLADELPDVGKGSYTALTAALHVAWTIPRRAYEVFPVAAVIGALAGLGALAPTAELTAMRAGGLSKSRIALAAVAAVGALLVLVLIGGETLAPWGEQRAQSLQAAALSKNLVARGRTGVWARDGETLLNAKRGENLGDSVVLFDLRIYEFEPDGRLTRIAIAARAEYKRDGWVLHDVIRQSFGIDSVTTEKLTELVWPSQIDPRLLALSLVEPRFLGLRDLSNGIAYYDRNALNAGEWRAAFWRRAFYPLSVLAVVLVAMPFAFGSLRSGGLGKRLFFGVLLATGWSVMQRGVTNVAAVYGLDFRLTQLLPALALILIAAWYFRRHA
jgi:lipopolysaccharide export system permease protein